MLTYPKEKMFSQTLLTYTLNTSLKQFIDIIIIQTLVGSGHKDKILYTFEWVTLKHS